MGTPSQPPPGGAEPRRGRFRPGVVTAAIVLAAAVGAAAVYQVGSANRRADRESVIAYEETIVGPARRAGAIVELAMKPAHADIRDGTVTGEGLAALARDWRHAFATIRAEFRAAAVPAALRGIDEAWERFFDAYVEAIRLFETAGLARGTARERLLDQAVERARDGDRLYDRASLILQRRRELLGLPPTHNFPNRPETGEAHTAERRPVANLRSR